MLEDIIIRTSLEELVHLCLQFVQGLMDTFNEAIDRDWKSINAENRT